jgi:protease PrsW
MLFYLFLLWRMDKNEMEPLPFLFVHFFWGALGAVILGITGNILLQLILGVNTQFYQIVLFAPVSEEVAKGLFLFYSVRSRQFDNMTDGLVYGGAIGLGFGMTENFFYFVGYGNSFDSWFYVVIVRSLFSAVMHCIATGALGASLGVAKFSSGYSRKILPLTGLLTAIMIHLIWNGSVSLDATYLFGFLFIIASTVAFLFIFKYSVKSEKKIIEKELTEESISGLLPESHIKILANNRFKRGWIDRRIRKRYSRAAIRLAFSKHQAKSTYGDQREYYMKEIDKNRNEITAIISRNLVI